MINCKNCDSQVIDNYCSNCGQASRLKRIDKHYISHEVFHLFHFEKGFFYTVKELMTKPGISIREFITENRNRHMKPVAFLILTSLLYTLVAHFFHVNELISEKDKSSLAKSSVADLLQWVQTHYGYANIIMGIFITLCVKLLFRKHAYNFFEIIILICFVMGQGMLLLTVETLFIGLLGKQLYLVLLTIISTGYPTWAIGHFFGRTEILSYVKAFVAYILGYILFYIAIILIGIIVDLIIKM